MKYDITVIYKNTDNTNDKDIKKKYDRVELNLDEHLKYDIHFGGYYFVAMNKVHDIIREFLELDSEAKVNLPVNSLGEVGELSFIVEVYVPNEIIRKVKIDSVLN